jgi:hypothetical protein
MLLKRIYKKREAEPRLSLPSGVTSIEVVAGVAAILAEGVIATINSDSPAELDYLALAHTGVEPEQNFSTSLVVDNVKCGLMEIKDEKLIFHVHPEDLVYKIKRRPGRYCLHCGEKLPDDEKGELARLHIVEKHLGLKSPDPNNPSGYVALNHFECVLDEKQHNKFKVKKAAAAPKFFFKEVANG